MPPLVTFVRWSDKLPELWEIFLSDKFLLTGTRFQPFHPFKHEIL